MLLLWRMDRAFLSVLVAANTLERLRTWGVGLRSYAEPWLDTTSPFEEALYYITVAYAQLERGIGSLKTLAGPDVSRSIMALTASSMAWSTTSSSAAGIRNTSS